MNDASLLYYRWQPAQWERIPSGPLRLDKCDPGGILTIADTEDEQGRVAYLLQCMPGVDGQPCLIECDADGNPLDAPPSTRARRDTPEGRPPREKARRLKNDTAGGGEDDAP